MCASRMVCIPKRNPKLMNNNIREIPVTISAFSIGILFIPRSRFFGLAFILLRAIQVIVPISVAITDDIIAMNIVLYNACMIASFLKSSEYQWVVKPPHFALVRLLLKDRTINVTIGAYKKINIIAT